MSLKKQLIVLRFCQCALYSQGWMSVMEGEHEGAPRRLLCQEAPGPSTASILLV